MLIAIIDGVVVGLPRVCPALGVLTSVSNINSTSLTARRIMRRIEAAIAARRARWELLDALPPQFLSMGERIRNEPGIAATCVPGPVHDHGCMLVGEVVLGSLAKLRCMCRTRVNECPWCGKL